MEESQQFKEAVRYSMKNDAGRVQIRKEFNVTDHQARKIRQEALQRETEGEKEAEAMSPEGGKEEAKKLFEIIRDEAEAKDEFDEIGVDNILDQFCDWQETVRSLENISDVIELEVPADHPILLPVLADVHFGNVNTRTRKFLDDMKKIQERPYVKTLFAGDLGEGGILPQMLDLVLEQTMMPRLQRKVLWKLFERIVPNCLAFITGQHDHWTEKQAEFDWLEWFCTEHDVNYLGWGGCIFLTVGEQRYKILARHKYRYNSSYNVTHSVQQLMRLGPWGFGDVGIVADKHEYGYECSEIGGLPTAFMRPGSYKPSDHFMQEKGYNPARPFMPGLILWPDRRKFKGAPDWKMLLPEIDAMASGDIDWEDYPDEPRDVDMKKR